MYVNKNPPDLPIKIPLQPRIVREALGGLMQRAHAISLAMLLGMILEGCWQRLVEMLVQLLRPRCCCAHAIYLRDAFAVSHFAHADGCLSTSLHAFGNTDPATCTKSL